MCVIVDNDVVALVLVKKDAAFVPVMQAIQKRRHKLTYGGRLKDEYLKSVLVRRVLRVLDEAGLSRIVSDDSIASIESQLIANDVCKSNDAHVIALAQVSKTRLLCSRDNDLIADFTNLKLLSKPRGRVYKNADHRALVNQCCARCRPT